MNKKTTKSLTRHLLLALTTLGGLFLILLTSAPQPVAASPAPATTPTPPGPDRFTSMTVDVTLQQWWLLAWKDNQINCRLEVEHDKTPSPDDVYNQCGATFYAVWMKTSKPCTQTDVSACQGYYFMHVGQKTITREVPVNLPEPQIWVTIQNCEPDRRGWCTQQPRLILTAEEPLPNHTITRIEGKVGSDSFTCEGNTCAFNLSTTKPEGVQLTFWAYSTYGDSSRTFDALVGVLSNRTEKPDALLEKWYVNVLSAQWAGKPIASCAKAWGTFPPVDDLPSWLLTPETSADLQSNIPYAYLAGNLIAQGAVNVSSCADGGLLANGAASPCGLDAARPVVDEWQDRFDHLIFDVAAETEVPAQLLKNLFSRESQFWPGVFRNSDDVGLGQLTEKGADTMLLWNRSFYRQFCPLVLDKSVCAKKGYANLKPNQQAMLMGALVRSVDATCDTCPLGIDLSRADFSISVFARTLLANCEQAGKAVQEVTGERPGINVSYEDMWRFTLVNYNAGVGCLYDALDLTGDPLTWEAVAPNLQQVCPGAPQYVEDVAKSP